MGAATTAPRSSQADSPKHDWEPHVPPMHQDRDRGLRWHINGIKNVILGSPTVQRVPQAQFSGMPRPVRTKPITCLGAVFCTNFCIVIFLGGLSVLIVYLVYRPRSPRFDVSSATLNTAYIDAGSRRWSLRASKLNQSKQESECRLQLPDHWSILRTHCYC